MQLFICIISFPETSPISFLKLMSPNFNGKKSKHLKYFKKSQKYSNICCVFNGSNLGSLFIFVINSLKFLIISVIVFSISLISLLSLSSFIINKDLNIFSNFSFCKNLSLFSSIVSKKYLKHSKNK